MMHKKWIVGVSGGPDSMALLDILSKQNIPCVAAHVNYGKRETSKRDEDIVRKYCEKNHILFECSNYEDDGKNHNFQHQARAFRYAFFKELVLKYNAEGVAIAHHFNDDLETYLFQKHRKMESEHVGLAQYTEIMDVTVWRPLLDMTKDMVVQYCDDHQIQYGIDESNLSLDYTRNQIRNDIHYMDENSYESLVKEMLAAKQYGEKRSKMVKSIALQLDSKVKVDMYALIQDGIRPRVLRLWMAQNGVETHTMSGPFLKELDTLILQEKAFIQFGNKRLSSSYGELAITDNTPYEYHFTQISHVTTDHFVLSDSGRTIQGVTLSELDFPIMIRNARKGDSIKMRFGTKSLNRFFIDRKIPRHQREIWPVIVNSSQQIVFVVGMGCDEHHYSNNPNLFMLEL
ncbi:tRNA lysidine(34) synthetase TilS [Erysipelothrix rhusiopathiae]|nr:tRNA lysidine(34) synthetase TilS [Erysipelothrix rhusiopathiae]